MKIQTFGARGFTCQLPRIDEGFRALGHEVVEAGVEVDLIYCNNAPYAVAIAKAAYDEVPSICNVLDIPEHLFPNFDLEGLKKQLDSATAVTCISNSVANQLKKYLDIDATVIYNPMKEVSFQNLELPKTIPFLYVGRANDPNKRFHLVRETIEALGRGHESLVVVGSENPGFGYYAGVVSDEVLNNLYASSKYVFLPSKFEGIGLSMIEGLVAGCIPILCDDNVTAREFAPPICRSIEPTPESLIETLKLLEADYFTNLDTCLAYGEKYKIQFSKEEVAKNILGVYNKLK